MTDQNEIVLARLQTRLLVVEDWTDQQAVDDIERQLQGIGFEEQTVDDTIRPYRSDQKLLIEALTAPVGDTPEGQYWSITAHFPGPFTIFTFSMTTICFIKQGTVFTD